MTTQGGVFTGLAGGGLLLALLSFLSAPAPPAVQTPRAVTPVERWEAAPRLPETSEAAAEPTPAKAAMVAAPAQKAEAETTPRPLAFRFLGKMKSGTGTAVVLHADGRTLTVNGPGPVQGSEYVVDSFQEHYVVLRHARLGNSQLVELTPPAVAAAAAWSPADSPQD